MFACLFVCLNFLKLAARLTGTQGKHLEVTLTVQNALHFFKASEKSVLTRQHQQTVQSLTAIKLLR